MPTYLLTWNPEESPDDGPALHRIATDIAAGMRPRGTWSAGNTQNIQTHDRVFLLRQGRYAHGIIGSGLVTQGSHRGPHRDPAQRRQGRQSLFVKLEWDTMVPQFELPRVELLNGILPQSLLRVGSSGAEIPPALCRHFGHFPKDRLQRRVILPFERRLLLNADFQPYPPATP
jgi:hypothetical protein